MAESRKIFVLGSGAATPSAHRKNSSYILQWGERIALIDCSGSPAHEVLRRGFDLEAIDGIYLTHEHVDHVYGLPSLIHGMWVNCLFQDRPLHIYGSPSTLQVARSLLALFRLEDRQGYVHIQWHPLNPDHSEQSGGSFQVKSYPVTHGDTEALAYCFDGVLFTGDCISDDRLRDAVSNAVNTIIVDCGGGISGNAGHAGTRQIASLIAENRQVSNVYLSHVANSSTPSDLLQALADLETPVSLLEDGIVIDI